MLRIVTCLTTFAFSLLHAKPLTNHLPTNTLPVTTCEHEGKFYSPGETFGEGTDGQGWCYGLFCSDDGDAIPWDNFNCHSTTSPMPNITTSFTTQNIKTPRPPTTYPAPTTTTRPMGCEYKGQFYSPGDRFSEGTDGQGWCYGSYCSDDGQIITWDNFNCHSTTPPMPNTTTSFTTQNIKTPKSTRPPTTYPVPMTTTRPPCEYKGQFYSPGDRFGEGTDGEGWCYGSYCSDDGLIVTWDNFNCHSTTSPMPTITTENIKTPFNTTPKTTVQNIKTPFNTTSKTTTQNIKTPFNTTPKPTIQNIKTPFNTTPKTTTLSTTLLLSIVFGFFLALTSAH